MSNSSRVPWVTLMLIGANLVPAFVLLFDPIWIDRLGFLADRPSVGTAISSMFLHQNVLHLLGNMLFLAAVGPAVEMAAGWWRFLIVYLVGGLIGTLGHLLIMGHVSQPAPLLGASGAVAACIGYASVRYLHVRVPLSPKVSVPVYAVALIWVGLQIIGAFVRIGDSSGGVAFWAHIGGFLGGILLSLIFRVPEGLSLEWGRETIADMSGRSPAAIRAAAEQHLKIHPTDPTALRQLAEACHQLGESNEEGSALIRLLEVVPEAEQASLFDRLVSCGSIRMISSSRRTMLAERFRAQYPEVTKQLLKSVVDGPRGDAQRPDAILSLATLELSEGDSAAEALLAELVQSYPLHPATEVARTKGLIP